MEKDPSADLKRLKQEFLMMERTNREERDTLARAVHVLGSALAGHLEIKEEWEAFRQQIQEEGPLPLDLIDEGLRRVKDKIYENDQTPVGLLKELQNLKERLQEAHRAIRRMMLSLVDDLYPLTGEMKAKAASVEERLTQAPGGTGGVAEDFREIVKALRTKIQEDFRYVNSEFLSLLNQVKEFERILARDFVGEDYVKKVSYFEMKVNEEVCLIADSFDLQSTVAEIKSAVMAKIDNIKKMVLARKEEEMERFRTAQKSILGLQRRIAEAEKTASEMARRADEFQSAAMRDGLTRLYNRKGLDLKLKSSLQSISEGGPPFAFILFDVDRFKSINDTFGHVAGDKVLQKVAQVLSETFRKGDFIARFGGDEFGAIIDGMDQEMASERVSSFRASLGRKRFTSYKHGDFRIGVSAGIAFVTSGETFESVLERADRAMYEDKNQCRDRKEPGIVPGT